MAKTDGRKIPRDVLEHYRLRAMELKRKGKKINDIAEFFGINRGSVSRWFTKYRRYGEGILRKHKAKGAKPKLSDYHKKNILQWLEQPATDFGFETPLWTCRRVQQLVKKKLRIQIHISNIWEWLRKWNLTNQKPIRRAFQYDEKKVDKWLKEEWPKIRKHARRWQAMLYFLDECGVSLIPVLGKTWAPKGKPSVVKVTGNKGGFCVTSAISPAGRMVFRIEKKRINAELHIEFLQQIMKHHPNRKVIVIEDNAPSHIARKVDYFVEANKKRFAIYNIPSYSPELNPDEHVWAYLKNHQIKTHQAQTKEEFKSLIISKMRSVQRSSELVKSFFIKTYVT